MISCQRNERCYFRNFRCLKEFQYFPHRFHQANGCCYSSHQTTHSFRTSRTLSPPPLELQQEVLLCTSIFQACRNGTLPYPRAHTLYRPTQHPFISMQHQQQQLNSLQLGYPPFIAVLATENFVSQTYLLPPLWQQIHTFLPCRCACQQGRYFCCCYRYWKVELFSHPHTLRITSASAQFIILLTHLLIPTHLALLLFCCSCYASSIA